MSRAPFKPTDEQRNQVAICAGGGMSHEELAIALGIDRNTLEKHFSRELSEGAYLKRGEVIQALHGSALKGNASAAKCYLDSTPELAPPPPQEAAGEPAAGVKTRTSKGKKEQAAADAKTAAKGTGWDGLLPSAPTQ